jgi:hypothetical protein
VTRTYSLPPAPRPWRVATTLGTVEVEATTAAQAILSALELAGARARLSGLQRVASGPRYDGLADLFAAPGTLELATDEELRAVVVEFVAAIQFLGNPKRVEITLR